MTNDFKIDFVGIGAVKCGTTWIYECLQEHPQLSLAPKDQAQIALFFKESPSEAEMEEYKSFFWDKGSGILNGDFHIGYLEDKKAVYRIKKHNPDIKIIVCLRNPIERVYSHYRYLKFSRNKDWDNLEQGLKQEPKMLEPGFYYKHLRIFFDNFPRENVLVLIYEEIKRDKKRFIQQIYKFLGVDDTFVPPSINIKVNLTQFKLTKLGKFIHKGIAKPLLKNTKWAWKLKQSIFIKKALCCLSEHYPGKDRPCPSIKEGTREYLRDIYREDIQNLEELINKDLSFWQ